MSLREREDNFRYEYKDRQVEEAQLKRKNKRKEERAKRLAAQKTPEERARISRQHRLFWLCMLVLIIAVVIVVRGASVITDLRAEKKEVSAQLDQLTKQRDQLTEELGSVQNDEYVEQQARSEFGMIYPGEIRYIIKHSDEPETEAAIDSENDED